MSVNPDPADIEEALPPTDRLQRWRLVLGSEANGSCGAVEGRVREIDQALAALYEADGRRGLGQGGQRGGRGDSAPSVARWLGDIR